MKKFNFNIAPLQVLLNMYLGTVIEIAGINVVMYTASAIACVGAFVSLSLPVVQVEPRSIYKTVSAISIGKFKSFTYSLLVNYCSFKRQV